MCCFSAKSEVAVLLGIVARPAAYAGNTRFITLARNLAKKCQVPDKKLRGTLPKIEWVPLTQRGFLSVYCSLSIEQAKKEGQYATHIFDAAWSAALDRVVGDGEPRAWTDHRHS
jgi:hypothetical protein